MRILLNCIKQIFLALLILFGVFIVTVSSIGILNGLIELFADPMMVFTMSMIGPHSLSSWLIILSFVGVIILFPLLLAIWVFKDSRKFNTLEVKRLSFLWAIGVFLPTTIIVFPLYLIKRNILWATKESNNSISNKEAVPTSKKSTKMMKIFGVIIGLFVIYIIAFGIIVSNRTKSSFRPIISSIVRSNLKDNCNKSPDCDELRPIPKILQNKKIVFNKNTKIEFDPLNEIKLPELDILGFLDTGRLVDGEKVNFTDPALRMSGNLEEREYKIVRAVYSYKCNLCIDSSDIAYIVVEDSKGNRFMVFLDEYDSSVSPGRSLSWDEYIPYFLGKDSEGKEILEAKLENI